jgi:hypothetical protein
MPRKEPFKAFLDQFFYDLRLQTKVQEHQMDMFDFIRTKNLPILADISKQWFKQIWLPLILKGTPLSQSKIQPPQLGGLEIVLTKHIFAFMGYEGPHDRQQEKFIGLLDRSSITYRMCSADDENEFIKNAPKT